MRPILRYRQSEIRLRAERFADTLGDGAGHLGALGNAVAGGGGALLVSDVEQVLLPLSSAPPADEALVQRGIVPGSCWDERIAGTNGIQMALASQGPFTVRGAEHFFVGLRQFICCSVPLLDGDNRIIGTLTSAAVEQSAGAGQPLAAVVMQIAARRLQAAMFRRRHAGRIMLSLAPLGSPELDGAVNALVALDETGRILAATRRAARIAGSQRPDAMVGQDIAALFGVGLDRLLDAPGWFARSEGNHPSAIGLHVTLPIGIHAAPGFAPRATPDAGARMPPVPLLPRPGWTEAMAETEAAFRQGLPVLLIGETGTGKSVFAQTLHSRARAPVAKLVTIDCAQIEPSAEGRLRIRLVFEHALQTARETGAASTVILDHLEALGAAPQGFLVEILAMLEDQPETLRGVPAPRIVALCGRPPEALIAAGVLRDDLLYRMQGTRVVLPALREDAVALGETLIRLAQDAAGWNVPIREDALAALMAHAWPGNLREARRVIALACSRAHGGPIRLAHLPSYLSACGASAAACAPPEARILHALNAAGWNVSAAARRLGISRATLHRKIRRLGLGRPGSRPS
ncbi:hypothetical protein U879_14205 [Defluviimonas sp. 20V17]|uniref:ATPase AAA n=1 Tax=Allgaiera indica TaxID=765699 RepID=A0AAN4UNK1_9RHOB|nr:hypothetical protein U879_14205 [Defluviimonas sp. 20V17]GHD98633.1 ATPase AAA [Allgaiera indica]